MNVSSGNSAFERIDVLHTAELLRLLNENSLRDAQFIEGQFCERGQNFADNLALLKLVGWVEEFSGQISLTARFPGATNFRPDLLVEAIANSDSEVRGALAGFLNRFVVSNDSVSYSPSVSERLDGIGVRNLLIRSGIVTYDPSADCYHLNQQFAHLYIWAKQFSCPLSGENLAALLGERARLGALAELAVVVFERGRVGPALAKKVEHVSLLNAGSCYDIKSVTSENDLNVPRFIEVKAVSPDMHDFFWSASEVEAAALLRDRYYLYLIPVTSREGFDFASMRIIRDPYRTVYLNEAWDKHSQVTRCRPK